jgi:hypothetical protein
MRNTTQLTLALNAVLMLTGVGFAQTTQQPAKTPQTAPSVNAAIEQATEDSSPAEQSNTAPIFWISSVEVMRSTHAPLLDVVRVRGLANTPGWESVELVPLTKNVPVDGILDLVLVGDAPADSIAATAYPPVEAIFTLEPYHPFRGIRVHGADNRVTVRTFPGYAEATTTPIDCSACTGKYFLHKGESANGHAKETIVREEDLPHTLRVIRSTDGVGALDSQPNRMTLILDEDGKIVTASWD